MEDGVRGRILSREDRDEGCASLLFGFRTSWNCCDFWISSN